MDVVSKQGSAENGNKVNSYCAWLVVSQFTTKDPFPPRSHACLLFYPGDIGSTKTLEKIGDCLRRTRKRSDEIEIRDLRSCRKHWPYRWRHRSHPWLNPGKISKEKKNPKPPEVELRRKGQNWNVIFLAWLRSFFSLSYTKIRCSTWILAILFSAKKTVIGRQFMKVIGFFSASVGPFSRSPLSPWDDGHIVCCVV